MKQSLIRLLQHIFRSWRCLWRTGNPKFCLGGGNSGQLRRFRFGRYDDGICGLERSRQNPPLATVIDPLVVRGTCISAMAYARPLHDLWDFAMTAKRPREPNRRVPASTIRKINQGLFSRLNFQTDPLPATCQRTKRELCSLYVPVQGGGHVEGFC